MGGGVMQDRDFAAMGDVDGMVKRLGMLPDAPMAMPKQRLEAEPPSAGLMARLFGRAAVAGDPRTSGQ